MRAKAPNAEDLVSVGTVMEFSRQLRRTDSEHATQAGQGHIARHLEKDLEDDHAYLRNPQPVLDSVEDPIFFGLFRAHHLGLVEIVVGVDDGEGAANKAWTLSEL